MLGAVALSRNRNRVPINRHETAAEAARMAGEYANRGTKRRVEA